MHPKFHECSVDRFTFFLNIRCEHYQNGTKLHGEVDYEYLKDTLSTYPLISRLAWVSNQSAMVSSQNEPINACAFELFDMLIFILVAFGAIKKYILNTI